MKIDYKITPIILALILWIAVIIAVLIEGNALAIEPSITPQVVVPEKVLVVDKLYHDACGELGDQCAIDLKAIAIKESGENDMAIGDGGTSFGRFQIHLPAHPEITVEQAQDPEFSSDWTVAYLTCNGYPEYRTFAVRRHNGSVDNPVTYEYFLEVDRISKSLW